MSQAPAQPSTRRPLVILGMAAASAALAVVVGLPLLHRAPLLTTVDLPWWFFAAAFAAAQFCTIHIQTGRGEQTVSAAACPMIIGLFFTSPAQLLVSGLLGTLVVQFVRRRACPEKMLFNLALFSAETVLAAAIVGVLPGPPSGSTPITWLVTFAAVLAGDVLSSIAIGVVIAILDGGLSLRALVRTTVEGAAALPLVTSLSLVAVTCLSLSPESGWLLLVTGVGFLLAFRGYAALTNRRLNVHRLHRFSQAFGLSTDFGDGLGDVLTEAREVLASQRAEVLLVGADGELTRLVLDSSGAVRPSHTADDGANQLLFNLVVGTDTPVLMPRGTREAQGRRCLEALRAREAVAAPLRSGSKGVLVLADRVSDARTYDEQDVLLLETVANHVSAALRSGDLIQALRHEALHDSLTALPNRSLLQRRLSAALEAVGQGRSPGAAVMILDLDGFKQINDTLGHHQGDLLLAEIGARLGTGAGRVVPTATVARLGGDEFAVLVPDVADEVAVLDLGRRLLAAIEPPIALGEHTVRVGGSLGFALAPLHGTEPTALLKHADLAMYAAKVTGDGLRIYDPRLGSELVS